MLGTVLTWINNRDRIKSLKDEVRTITRDIDHLRTVDNTELKTKMILALVAERHHKIGELKKLGAY